MDKTGLEENSDLAEAQSLFSQVLPMASPTTQTAHQNIDLCMDRYPYRFATGVQITDSCKLCGNTT